MARRVVSPKRTLVCISKRVCTRSELASSPNAIALETSCEIASHARTYRGCDNCENNYSNLLFSRQLSVFARFLRNAAAKKHAARERCLRDSRLFRAPLDSISSKTRDTSLHPEAAHLPLPNYSTGDPPWPRVPISRVFVEVSPEPRYDLALV